MQADVVVVGAGPGGRLLAEGAAKAGLSVIAVEERLVGGLCPFWACMPSKALLRPGAARHAAETTPGISRPSLNPASVMAWRDDVISHLDDAEKAEQLVDDGVELVRGRGRLTGPRRLAVECADGDVRTIEAAELVVLAVGTVGVRPDIPGLGEIDAWSIEDATTAQEVPSRLLVLGGGAVGCELAQAYARLGAAVTLVEAEAGLLGGFHARASAAVEETLALEDIDVLTGCGVERFAPAEEGFVAHLDSGAVVEADRVLLAIGRRPATDDLGLESVGVAPNDDGSIAVDDHLRVEGESASWLAAIGDVNGRMPTTHHAHYQAGVVVDALRGAPRPASSDELAPAQVVFTDPPIGRVGLDLDQAQERYGDARELSIDFDRTAAAAIHPTSAPKGEGIFVVASDQLVGATLFGPHADELLHAASVAIVGEVPLTTLVHAVPSFPTFSQIWELLVDPAERPDAALG